MKLYVFETDKWLESDVVYPHDIALCLYEDKNKIYIYDGVRVTTANKKLAEQALEPIKHKFPQYTIEYVDEKTPRVVREYINQYVNTSFEEIEQIDREPQYVAFYYMLLGLFVGLAFTYIMIFRIIGWEKVPETSVLMINQLKFANWTIQNYIILIVMASLFGISLVFAGLTQKIFLIITASVGILVLTGTLLYFRLGVYLFDFKPGAPIGYYYISIGAVVAFFFINFVALSIIVVPMIISVNAIRKTTIPITWAEWKKKRKAKVVEMEKFSIIDVMTQFTELEKQKNKEDLEKSLSKE